MNEFLSIFITWQFLVLCIGIAAITFVLRTIIEFAVLDNPHMPGSRASSFWRDVVLVILPIILGMIFAVVGKSFPYPEVLSESYSKFLFSASAGLLSPTLYRVIRALLWKNTTGEQPMPPFQPIPGFPPVDPNVIANLIVPQAPVVLSPPVSADPPVVMPTQPTQSVVVNVTQPTADDVNKVPSEPTDLSEPKL